MRLRIQVLDVERTGVRLVIVYPDRRAETVSVPVGEAVAIDFGVTETGGLAFVPGDKPESRLSRVRRKEGYAE